MAANNYFGFTHGGTQYGAAATGAAYPTAQTGYAVAPAATATAYGTQRAASTAYDTAAYQAAATQGTYATTGTPTAYDYGYGRAATTYDATKTYYQQAGATAGYTATPTYDTTAAVKPAYQTTANYATPAVTRATNQTAKATQYTAAQQAYSAPVAQTYQTTTPAATVTPKQTTTGTAATANAANTYSGYDAAIYSAATMYVAQQQKGQGGVHQGGWQGYNKKGGVQNQGSTGGGGGGGGGGGMQKMQRPKQPPKPQQLHYCDVCRISCAGPQTYREHLEGQKHKKREASLKLEASVVLASQNRAGNALRCELCDVTCTGNDAYAAHVRGAKHQKVVKLHTKLGKPIPSQEPLVVGGKRAVSNSKIAFVASGNLGTTPSVTGATAAPAAGNNGAAAEESAANDMDTQDVSEPDIQPVGQEYIEEMKGEDGKVVSFNCKLCDCRFNDPNAKEMHMKGRRHRLQYKKKVQPDLVVDLKPSLRQRKMQEVKRAAIRDEFWARRRAAEVGRNLNEMEEDERMYWEERRRYEDECDYLEWFRRGPGPFPGPPRPPMMGRPGPMGPPPPFFGIHPQGPRRPESSDDRHVIAKHAEIYPKEEELQVIQRIVSHTERALKFVSDALTDQSTKVAPPAPIIKGKVAGILKPAIATPVKAAATPAKVVGPVKPAGPGGKVGVVGKVVAAGKPAAVAAKPAAATPAVVAPAAEKKDEAAPAGDAKKEAAKEDGRDNQLFSFQKDAEGSSVRLLKGVMRVGLLAKGLLLQGDHTVQLVVLCAEKPTSTLLKKVFQELPNQLKKVSEEFKYKVAIVPTEAGITISDGTVTVLVSLTSPLIREQVDGKAGEAAAVTGTVVSAGPTDLLPQQKCLDALAALRHAKWFQARATPLHNCVMVIRILRDLCQRVPTWAPLNPWAMELLVEKVILSSGAMLSPGECMRRLLECVAGGVLLPGGPGLLDPCEKEPQDALGNLSAQQREDLTVSAQQSLRQVAFRQIHKVLGMEVIPMPKNHQRVWRFTRKRRRSNTESADAEGDGKVVKKDDHSDAKTDGKMEVSE